MVNIKSPTQRVKGYSTIGSLQKFVCDELDVEKPDYNFILRVIPHEIKRWYHNNLTDDELKCVYSDYDTTTWKTWDALLEGVVLYYSHKYNKRPPDWTKRTNLETAFCPRDFTRLNNSNGTTLVRIMETPAEFSSKGVVFARSEMDIV